MYWRIYASLGLNELTDSLNTEANISARLRSCNILRLLDSVIFVDWAMVSCSTYFVISTVIWDCVTHELESTFLGLTQRRIWVFVFLPFTLGEMTLRFARETCAFWGGLGAEVTLSISTGWPVRIDFSGEWVGLEGTSLDRHWLAGVSFSKGIHRNPVICCCMNMIQCHSMIGTTVSFSLWLSVGPARD